MWTAVMTDAVRSCIQATRRRQWAIKQRNPRRYCSGRAGNPKAVIQSLQCDLLVCQLSAPPARLIRHPSLTFVIVHRSLPPPCRAATAQMSKKTIKTRITKLGACDDLKPPWRDYEFDPKRFKIKVTRLKKCVGALPEYQSDWFKITPLLLLMDPQEDRRWRIRQQRRRASASTAGN